MDQIRTVKRNKNTSFEEKDEGKNKKLYLRIPGGFAAGGDEVCGGGSCSKRDSWATLGRAVYYLPYYLLSCLSLASGLSFFRLLYLSGLGRVYSGSEGGDNKGGRLGI